MHFHYILLCKNFKSTLLKQLNFFKEKILLSFTFEMKYNFCCLER